MSYFFEKTVKGSMESVEEKVVETLKSEGFGILTEIDVKATFKKKLDVDFRPYKILGACNPPFAHQALQSEANIGLMLPCNVVLQQQKDNEVHIAIIDPAAAMGESQNPDLLDIASKVRDKLHNVITQV